MNYYLDLITKISTPNKYLKWYISIIEKALERAGTKSEAKVLVGYCEGHHIVPKSFKLGGELDSTNLVYLSIKEHLTVHALLTKCITGKYKKLAEMAYYAVGFMGSNSLTIRQQAKLIQYNSEFMKDTAPAVEVSTGKRLGRVLCNDPRWLSGEIISTQAGELNHMFGKKHTDESRLKISANRVYDIDGAKNPKAKKWRVVSPEGIEYLLNGTMNKFCTEHKLVAWTIANSAKTGKSISKGACKGWQAFYVLE